MLAIATVGVVVALGAGHAQAYQTVYGEDGNGANAPLATSQIVNALAAQASFFGGRSWQAESFENQATGPGPLTLGFGSGERAVNATLSGGAGAVVSGASEGRYSVPGGSKYWSVSVGASTSPFTVLFNQNVEAFGFFGIDIGDFGGSLDVQLLDASGNAIFTQSITALSRLDTASKNGSVLYWGISAASSSEWFRGVRFVQQNPGTQNDGFAFDSFTVVGAPRSTQPPPPGVPEPASLALVGAALLGLAAARRKA